MDADIIVVGAGLSGLVAAHTIRNKDKSVKIHILEAKDRVGGRTLTVALPTEKGECGCPLEYFDLGGHWVGHNQRHVMSLIWEMGLVTYPQYTKGRKVTRLGGTHLQTCEARLPSLTSWYAQLELQFFISKAEKMCQEVSMLDPGSSAFAPELDGMTAQSFVFQTLRTASARELVEVAIQTMLGGVLKLFGVEGGCQELCIKGGAQQISEILADIIGWEYIHLESPVTLIVQDRHCVTMKTKAGRIFRASHAIIAIPPNMILQVTFDPPLLEPHRRALEGHPMGHLSKFVVTYQRPFWRKLGFSGEVVSNGGESPFGPCPRGPITVVYDGTSYNGVPALVGFFSGSNGVAWSQHSKEKRMQAVVSGLIECFGAEAQDPVSYEDKFWGNEPYTGGCPACFGCPGQAPGLPLLRQPVGRLFWAGTETALEWTGFMSGAVESGQRSALELLYHIRPQSLTTSELQRLHQLLEPLSIQPRSCPQHSVFRWTLGLPLLAILAIGIACAMRHRFGHLVCGRIC